MDAPRNEQQKRSSGIAADEPVAEWTDPWALSQWDYMHRKLRAAGATQTEVNDFRAQWLHDPTWPLHDKQRVLALGDAKMRAEVLSARDDALRDASTDDEMRALREAQARAEAARVLRYEAEEMSAWEPHAIVEWVGEDLDRARASLAVEEEHPFPRAGLIAALIRLLDDRAEAPA